MKRIIFAALGVVALLVPFGGFAQREKTAFQTSSGWIPQIDVRSDMAIVYGTGDRKGLTFEQRVQSWRDHGYQIAFMTGIAWGAYFDYFLGKWDGQNHLGVGQVTMKGDTIWHGHNMPYVVPVASFLEYMKTAVVKRVIDAGVNRIFLEEPEFWARAGYSEPFKAEWQKFYGFPWRPQDASPENTYLSSKLKYQLYYNAIREVSNYAKAYARSRGVNLRVYIATHSLVNYSDDPYQSVMEWWDTKGRHYHAASEHLFGLLGLDPHAGTGRYPVGSGAVYVIRQDPKEFVLQHDGDGAYLDVLKKAFENDARGGALILKNSFYLERGPYDIISVLDENPDAAPYVVKGPVIDLFDPTLPVLDAKTVAPGEQSLLFDLARVPDKTRPSVLAAAARIYSEMVTGRTFSFIAKSPVNTVNSMRVLLPGRPVGVRVTDSQGAAVADVQSSWDEGSHTEYLGFANSPDGVKVELALP
jgi:hypothetical protein